MNINPGELNKRIKIVKCDHESRDTDGYPVFDYVTIRECWAKFTQQSGSETVKNGTEFSDAKCRFLVRYSKTEIDTSMNIQYNGKLYDIKYINGYGDAYEYQEIWAELHNRTGERVNG